MALLSSFRTLSRSCERMQRTTNCPVSSKGEKTKNGGVLTGPETVPVKRDLGDFLRIFRSPLSPAIVRQLVLGPFGHIGLALKGLALAGPTSFAKLAILRGMAQMVGTEVKAAAAVLAIGIDHAADEAQPAMNLIFAFRLIAKRRDAISDVATVLAFSD